MPPVGFEPTISAVERPQTYALDRTATWSPTLIVKYKSKMLREMYDTDGGVGKKEHYEIDEPHFCHWTRG